MSRWNVVGILGGLLLCTACNRSEYETDAKFVDLYTDLKLVSMALDNDLDRAAEMRRVVLAQHGMTSAEFHEHYKRLANHPEAWKDFQEQVVARIDSLQQKQQGAPNGQ